MPRLPHECTNITWPDLEALHDRLRLQAAQIAALSTDAHAEAQLPCALLADSRCRVHPVRPLHCQGWTSMDWRDCEAGASDPWHRTVRMVLPVLDMARQACDGMKAALAMAGLEAQPLELHSAVSCALDTPDAAAQWVQGRRVFARCTLAQRSVGFPE
jgi:Fe-S-cluster containining protein